jgi:hypothetical protein
MAYDDDCNEKVSYSFSFLHFLVYISLSRALSPSLSLHLHLSLSLFCKPDILSRCQRLIIADVAPNTDAETMTAYLMAWESCPNLQEHRTRA